LEILQGPVIYLLLEKTMGQLRKQPEQIKSIRCLTAARHKNVRTPYPSPDGAQRSGYAQKTQKDPVQLRGLTGRRGFMSKRGVSELVKQKRAYMNKS